ncbi:L10-interacting MYB domain-containing protein-like [Humulus lupulus]|uniref:L10-interacting MYB domain-containing protein-like n=1 Tax=Humulus lupulus TaxID=3486 RepID=UPI002B403509|nr:L10-interacting MYB domain-containing protein-like [Humulus lupulus]
MENEKNTCIQNESDIQRCKAVWDPEAVNLFLDFCIKEVDDGHRTTTYLDKIGYAKLITNMNNATGRVYTRVQLKNKWDGLKNDWKQLIDKETDWWNSKLQSHPNATKFRIRGIEPELEQKLDRIFMNIVAAREYAWTPSSGIIPSESEKTFNDNRTLYEQPESSDDEPEMANIDRMPEEGNNKRSTELLEKQNKKIRSRTIEIASVSGISEVMKVLDSLLGIEVGSDLYFFATRLFIVKEKREIFVSLKEPELKLKWLKYEHDVATLVCFTLQIMVDTDEEIELQ